MITGVLGVFLRRPHSPVVIVVVVLRDALPAHRGAWLCRATASACPSSIRGVGHDVSVYGFAGFS